MRLNCFNSPSFFLGCHGEGQGVVVGVDILPRRLDNPLHPITLSLILATFIFYFNFRLSCHLFQKMYQKPAMSFLLRFSWFYFETISFFLLFYIICALEILIHHPPPRLAPKDKNVSQGEFQGDCFFYYFTRSSRLKTQAKVNLQKLVPYASHSIASYVLPILPFTQLFFIA